MFLGEQTIGVACDSDENDFELNFSPEECSAFLPVSRDILVEFEVDECKEQIRSGSGSYANPYTDDFDDLISINEYSVDSYSNNSFRITRYTFPRDFKETDSDKVMSEWYNYGNKIPIKELIRLSKPADVKLQLSSSDRIPEGYGWWTEEIYNEPPEGAFDSERFLKAIKLAFGNLDYKSDSHEMFSISLIVDSVEKKLENGGVPVIRLYISEGCPKSLDKLRDVFNDFSKKERHFSPVREFDDGSATLEQSFEINKSATSFIDESGIEGFKKISGDFFKMASFIAMYPELAERFDIVYRNPFFTPYVRYHSNLYFLTHYLSNDSDDFYFIRKGLQTEDIKRKAKELSDIYHRNNDKW